VSTHNHSNSEYDSYVANHEYTNSEYDSYVANHEYTNSEYDNYVTYHLFTNEEYYDYVFEHLYTNWEYEVARFDFYYVFPAEQQFGVYDLEDELYGLEWIEPYQEGVFDCSEMSAYIEWDLENKGWNTDIIVGDSPFGSGYHAWLLVECEEGKYMAVEPTTIEIVWWDDPYHDGYWTWDYIFEDILEALDYNESEFDWWQ